MLRALLLGMVELRDGTRVVALEPKQRTVLAALALHHGRRVSIEALEEALWPDELPRTARRSLQAHLAHVRAATNGAVVARHGGYALDPERVAVDVAEMEDLLARSRSGDLAPGERAELLRAAEALWRGEPLEGCPDTPMLAAEVRRLQVLRDDLFEARVAAELAAGCSDHVVAELERFLADHPTAERSWALLVDAYASAGRRHEALGAYGRARTALAVELGLEPGPALRAAEAAVLVDEGANAATTSADLPAGDVTFCFTDIEGSTRLARSLGDDVYAELIEQHHRLLRHAWDAHGGHEVSTAGDAFFVAFTSADDALAAAASAQRAIAGASWPTDQPVRVRIGLHTGYARPRGGEYVALAVSQAARVVDAGHGGQILLTAVTVSALTSEVPGIAVRSLGRFRVRDFDGATELFTGVVDGAPAPDTAPRVRPAERHNLVRPTTSLVGREDDLRSLTASIGPGRLITVTGPGGVGKTRLATELALAEADHWPDGVWFVDFGATGDPALVDKVIADTVGAKAVPGLAACDELVEHLRDHSALLILDNCEHLVPAVASIAARLLSIGPGLGVLATSRVPLGLRGEVVVRLAPLDTSTATLETPAIRLFLDRRGPPPLAAIDDVTEIAKLCRILDGLPLALELAAARAATVPVEELLRTVRRSTTVLRSRDPTLPPRHRGLEDVLEWSLSRLEPAERLTLEAVALAIGGFDLDFAEALVSADPHDRLRVAERVWSLVENSLVQVEPAAGQTRYQLLATVRQHVVDHTPLDVHDRTVHRLLEYLLASLGPERSMDRDWMGRMAVELDNVRQAVDLAADVDGPSAQALLWSIGYHLERADAYRTGADEVGRGLARLEGVTPGRVALLTLLADLHLRMGEFTIAAARLAEAKELQLVTGPPSWDEAGVAKTEGELALRHGDLDGAVRLAENGLARFWSPRGRTRLWNLLGIARAQQGQLHESRTAFAEELAAAEAAGLEALMPSALGNMAAICQMLGDRADTARYQLAALEYGRALQQQLIEAFSMVVAAQLLMDEGAAAAAVTLQAVALRLQAEAGYEPFASDAEETEQLMCRGRELLGPEEYESTLAAAASRTVADAAGETAAVLRRIADQAGTATPTTDEGGQP